MPATYDVITVGGGLAGSTLARALAQHGCRVLVFERETRFKDRVRGEQMHPWGVAEARTLGIYQRLLETCGIQTRWWTTYSGGAPIRRRDLEQTPHRAGSFNLFHPDMQETLLQMAAEAGAEVRRGVSVVGVTPGDPARLVLRRDGATEELTARLVVGADGRASQVRRWAGFEVRSDRDFLTIAGALVEGPRLPPPDGVHVAGGPSGRVLIAPQRNQRARVYFMSRAAAGQRPLSGKHGDETFLAVCGGVVAPADWFENAAIVGPVAQFSASDQWVEHPVRPGVVLLGDAAATSNPCFGTGLSMTLVGVRLLRDSLFATSDWEKAISQYASDHDDAYRVVHDLTRWFAELQYAEGEQADERRAKVMPRLAEPGAPDILGLGPASPSGDDVRRLLMVEDTQPSEVRTPAD